MFLIYCHKQSKHNFFHNSKLAECCNNHISFFLSLLFSFCINHYNDLANVCKSFRHIFHFQEDWIGFFFFCVNQRIFFVSRVNGSKGVWSKNKFKLFLQSAENIKHFLINYDQNWRGTYQMGFNVNLVK